MYMRTCAVLRLRSRRAIEIYYSATPLRLVAMWLSSARPFRYKAIFTDSTQMKQSSKIGIIYLQVCCKKNECSSTAAALLPSRVSSGFPQFSNWKPRETARATENTKKVETSTTVHTSWWWNELGHRPLPVCTGWAAANAHAKDSYNHSQWKTIGLESKEETLETWARTTWVRRS